jgi:hypothetical protein
MAYTINRTDPVVTAFAVSDGTVDTTVCSLTLIGKNYPGYGEFQNENFVRLLENSANTAQPTAPMIGQLWYDKPNNLLKVYNGTLFRVVSGATAGLTEPPGMVAGDMWFDTTNTQLKVYNGTSSIVIGPSYTSATGTSGAIVDTIRDSSAGADHVVVKLMSASTTIAIISKDTIFTPNVAISGFSSIGPGITLNSAIAGANFSGSATTATTVTAAAQPNITSVGTLSSVTVSGNITSTSDNGLTVGASGDIKLFVTGDNGFLKNVTADGNLLIQVNDGGVNTTCMTVVGSTGNVNVDTRLVVTGNVTSGNIITAGVVTASGNITGGNVTTAGIANIGTLAVTGAGTVGTTLGVTGNITGGNLSVSTGAVTLGSIVNGNGNGVGNIGSSSTYFNTVFANATSARYADLAERFAADKPYVAGTVVELGGINEITEATTELSDRVFGVISSSPSYLMNSTAGTNLTHPPVALVGRVPVKVIGIINKGDRLVCAGNGAARAASANEITPFNVVGRALENKETIGEGIVVVFVTAN